MSGESAYVRELAETIGPRPATTDAEAHAADWVAQVFEAKGLEVIRQEIDTPRSDSWGPFITYVLSLLAVVIAFLPMVPLLEPFAGPIRIFAFIVALIASALLEMDLLGRFTMTSWLPKGPTQNVIARHIPTARRNEKLRKIVLVANLDSARASLITDTGLVKHQALIVRITLVASWLITLFALVAILPFNWPIQKYVWWIALLPALWLVFPMVVVIHKELVAKATDGANANASGIATMLGVVDRLLPEKGEVIVHAEPLDIPPPRTPVKWGAETVPEDSVLKYSPAGDADMPAAAAPVTPPLGDMDDDLGSWGDITPGSGQGSFEALDDSGWRSDSHPAAPDPVPSVAPDRPAPRLPFGDDDLIEDAFADTAAPAQAPMRAPEAAPAGRAPVPAPARTFDDVELMTDPTAPAALPPEAPAPAPGAPTSADGDEKASVFGWLGVDKGWDAKRKGKEIGSWDNFEEEDDGGGTGWKGGSVSDGFDDLGQVEPIRSRGQDEEYSDPRGEAQSFTGSQRLAVDDPDFTSDEIARIKRKVIQNIDRELAEKEIWFVATGAGEIGAWGMKAFLKEYDEELRDALIIGVYGVGIGNLACIDNEGGPIGSKRSDRRLLSAAKRIARDREMRLKAVDSRWAVTDIALALRERYRAMSVMAFDINGRIGNWRSMEDTADKVSEEAIAGAAEYVTELIREL